MKSLRSIVTFGMLLVPLCTAGCSNRPPLRLDRDSSAVVVHVETLGEYMTTVGHIQIAEAQTGKILLDLTTESGTPQIFNFRLVEGENPAHVVDPTHGTYHVREPKGAETFDLQKGVEYRVVLWGNGASHSEVSFHF